MNIPIILAEAGDDSAIWLLVKNWIYEDDGDWSYREVVSMPTANNNCFDLVGIRVKDGIVPDTDQ